MALQPGTNDSPPARRALNAAGRMVGFLVLTVPAMTVFGSAVLLPHIVNQQHNQYLLESKQAQVADWEVLVAANDKLIAHLPVDEVLTKRLAENQLAVIPDGEEVMPPVGAANPPDLLHPQPHKRPSPPPAWLLRLSRRLSNPPTRRGLVVLSLGTIITAYFLFSPPSAARRRKEDGQSPEGSAPLEEAQEENPQPATTP
ncbi:MAG: hypothetical protein LLG01_18220 [Planctomycetaceae bacterium]|nr:hypothetical protein [Planctomycetaceae bacterium]